MHYVALPSDRRDGLKTQLLMVMAVVSDVKKDAINLPLKFLSCCLSKCFRALPSAHFGCKPTYDPHTLMWELRLPILRGKVAAFTEAHVFKLNLRGFVAKQI